MQRDAHSASSDQEDQGELEQRHESGSGTRFSDAGDGEDRDLPEGHSLTGGEVERVRKRIKLRALAVYVIIKEEGEDELLRPTRSLIWSGATAGVAMGFSVLTLALLHQKLPEAPWRDLVASLGYAVGFLLVILGRQQLFTESTITAVLPFTSHPSSRPW
ncbi:MAG TPA: formate/nitrite transporter family protein [Chloroflexota bacterium]|nr:formate/nitrite transporter family protein [Chloroflexota bacterium]